MKQENANLVMNAIREALKATEFSTACIALPHIEEAIKTLLRVEFNLKGLS